jgi:hypothetical protein
MTQRMTKAHVEAKLATVNRMIGTPDPDWNTPRSIKLDGAYNGWRVVQVPSDGRGDSALSGFGYGTLRECANFLDGMIAALRL